MSERKAVEMCIETVTDITIIQQADEQDLNVWVVKLLSHIFWEVLCKKLQRHVWLHLLRQHLHRHQTFFSLSPLHRSSRSHFMLKSHLLLHLQKGEIALLVDILQPEERLVAKTELGQHLQQ